MTTLVVVIAAAALVFCLLVCEDDALLTRIGRTVRIALPRRWRAWLYSKLVKLVPRRKFTPGEGLIPLIPSMRRVVRLGLLFGIDLFTFGDSNGKAADDQEDVEDIARNLGVSVNISEPGSRMDQWAELIQHPSGMYLFRLVRRDPRTAIHQNLGGNNVLQRRMDVFQKSAEIVMNALSPHCAIVALVPMVHADQLTMIAPAQTIRDEIREANKILTREAKSRGHTVFDLHTPLGRDGVPYIFTHSDFVHFSELTDDRFRVPLLIEKARWAIAKQTLIG